MCGKVSEPVQFTGSRAVPQTRSATSRSRPGFSLSFQVIMWSSADQIAAEAGGDLAGKVTCESVKELWGHSAASSCTVEAGTTERAAQSPPNEKEPYVTWGSGWVSHI